MLILLISFFCLQPMEKAPLKDSDILILSSLTQIPTANPDAMIGEFCVNAGLYIVLENDA
jgi:integrator complex subunit 9